MNMNKGPPMSREEFQAMKADIRRKRERGQLNEREHLRDDRRISKEAINSGADVSSMKAKPRSMFKTERPDWPERASDLDRHHESCHSPLPPHPSWPPSKQRSSERDERDRLKLEEKAAAAAGEEQESRFDRKLKGSVFSRISFPGSYKEMATTTKKKKTTSSSSDANGVFKDHHRHHRDDMATHREGSEVSNGYRRSSYEQESSDEEEEDEDDDHHFKRRPSKRGGERESSRVSRERERDRSQGRVETKRR